MFLGAVKDLRARQEDVGERPLPSSRWQDFPFSRLSHHGEACCDIAREWVGAMDFAQLNGSDLLSGPRWLRHKHEWGPSAWPMHWCEVVECEVIDCGAHAALAHEAFASRGVAAFRAQFVQRYSADATSEWRRKWRDEQISDYWITEDLIYHEGNALLVGEAEVKLWDASAGWWMNARQSGGYGSLVAVRIFAEGQWGGGDGFRWGIHRIKPNVWHQIGL
ncbi:MAG: hypothetical protein JWN69_893 [Alphaproteobacteria bacterium]|nr:hypothetical protein [Alphaproteobacteria bacterium]